MMSKAELLIKITNTQLKVLDAIEIIALSPERYNEGFEKVREAFRELKEEVKK